MKNPLEYQKTPLPEGIEFNISPSAFSKFVEKPHTWYRDEVLKENPFTHNTSSVIGTCVHYCAELVAKGVPVDKDIIEEYIDSLDIHEEYDPEIVKLNYPSMAETLVNNYVLDRPFLEVETQHLYVVKDKYSAGGTIDRLEGYIKYFKHI